MRLALRSVWRDHTFAIVVTLVLILGIGANTAIFSIVNAVLLRPLPYKNPDQIVTVASYFPKTGRQGWVSMLNAEDWKAQSQSLAAMAIYQTDTSNAVGNGNAERVDAAYVGKGFFDVFTMTPHVGRLFSADEEKYGGNPAVILSYGLWQRWFQSDPHAVGKTVRILNKPFDIVGVMPAGFEFPSQTQLWMPLGAVSDGKEDRSANNYLALGRVRDGVSLSQASAEMATIGDRLAQKYPVNANRSVAITRLHDSMVQSSRSTLYLLLGAVALVLLIACANVANLILARVVARRRELAIRSALGASHSKLLVQLLLESSVLAIPAGIAGLFVGYFTAELFSRFAPQQLPGVEHLTLDWRVAAYTFAVSILASLVFSSAPMLQLGRSNLNDSLRVLGSHTSTGAAARRIQAAFVASELALSMALLIVAFLLVRSLSALAATDPGYDPHQIVVMDSSVPSLTLEDSRRAVAFYHEVLANASKSPQIKSVSAVNALPNGRSSNGRYLIDNLPGPASGDYTTQSAGNIVIAPGYFELLNIPRRSGRDFSEQDAEAGQRTCIINESLAREAFPNSDPIGHTIITGMDGSLRDAASAMTIVGVVADIRQYGLESTPSPILYMPYQQHPLYASFMKVLARPRGNTESVISELRAISNQRNPEVALKFSALDERLEKSLAAPRFRSILLGSFAGLALLLSAIGLYGTMAYSVAQRTKEMAIRIALGATGANVFRLILGEGMRIVVFSLLAGVVLAQFANKLVAGMMYGIKTIDPLTYAASALLFATIAAVALFVPAHAATKTDPIEALRQE